MGSGRLTTQYRTIRLPEDLCAETEKWMAGRFDKEFAHTPIGTVQPNGQQVQWELINIFRYTDEGRLVEEWVQTDRYDFLRQLGAFGN